MSSDKYEWEQNPDSGDQKNNDFRDDLITLSNDEILASPAYVFHRRADHQVWMVIGENETLFQSGLPDRTIQSYNKYDYAYVVLRKEKNKEEKDKKKNKQIEEEIKEIRTFLDSARQHRLEEILQGSP